MRREATCICRWGGREGRVTVLLESSELIVRGDIRRRVALQALENVRAGEDTLEFTIAGERIELALGAERAPRWAAAIEAPKPTLARKLGITSAMRIHVTGELDDPKLETACSVAIARAASLDDAGLALIRTDNRSTLEHWAEALALPDRVPPAWVAYTKGRAAPLGESNVREIMRARGFVDTKVAAVSERLTALRFTNAR